jgi:hypothetical protein
MDEHQSPEGLDSEATVPDPTESPDDDVVDSFAPPFATKTFGGAFVWAQAPGYIATVLRIRAGENVVVSTKNRKDMTAMLTGGRALLETHDGRDVDRVELMPASPVAIQPGRDHRLIALTEVELFTVYTPLSST